MGVFISRNAMLVTRNRSVSACIGVEQAMGDFTKHHKGAGILSHRTETLLTASGEVSKACSGDTQADAD